MKHTLTMTISRNGSGVLSTTREEFDTIAQAKQRINSHMSDYTGYAVKEKKASDKAKKYTYILDLNGLETTFAFSIK